MSEKQMVIRCLNCGTKNRIPKERLHDRPLCGKCAATLDDMIIRCLRCGMKNRMPENRLTDQPLCGKCGTALVMNSEQGRPIEVTDGTFSREILSTPGSVLVDCWAPWCGPCRTVAPILDELASKYAGGVRIAKLNVDENPVTASRYNVRSIPTLLLFKDGKLVNTLVGALPKETIEQHLISIMKTN
jgi:thioredoxin 2